MPILSQDVVGQTALCIIAFLALILLTIHKKPKVALDKATSTALKGFALFGVLFAHIGYALAQDPRFLFPLSIVGGVCLNLFLFLSGYGLTQSMQEKPLSLWSFYKRRLDKILFPFWITLGLFLLMDASLLHITRPWPEILSSFFGFFPKADLFTSLNSPLWYITFILANYLLFPIVFIRRSPLISAVIMAAIGYVATYLLPLPVTESVRDLYRIHILAFPLGIAFASLPFKSLQARLEKTSWFVLGFRLLGTAGLSILFASIALNHAAIGQGWAEQRMSLLATGSLLGAFLLSPVESRLLTLFGLYSFEIYLLHWPLLSRYPTFYLIAPGAVATILSLLSLLGLGWLLQKTVTRLTTKTPHP